MTEVIRASERGVRMDVLVVPNARRTAIVGIHGDRIKVRLASPPEKNAANKALIALCAQTFAIRRVEIVAGRTTRWKTVELAGATVAEVNAIVRDLENVERHQRRGKAED